MRIFDIIPAIDLLDGRVVRLYRGDYSQATVYSENPGEIARTFSDQGARIIHVVDLNAARNKDRSVNEKAIGAILDAVRGKSIVEVGGGIRSMDSIREYMGRGVDRLILGTAAVSDPDFLKNAMIEYGAERIIAGVDAKDGSVRVQGWESDSGVRVRDFLPRLEQAGVREIIFTDIHTDGTLSGPAIDSLEDVLNHSRLRVIASGGVSSLSDIERLLAMGHSNLVGAITGRAVYEEKLNVAEAIQLVREAI